MEKGLWQPCWIRGSRIEEIVWIGKEVLAWCSGVYIIFFHIIKKRQSLRWCSDEETGEGACCLSGHVNVPVFAFSEKTLHPRILIYVYPSMTKISECVRGSPNGYLATAFTVNDHLVSMGNYPHFSMIIWSWRTGDKVATVDTTIRDRVGQILRVTQSGPTTIAQMGKTCGKLFTWELDVVGKVVTTKDHEIMLPKARPIYWVDWCPYPGDPLLAITDKDGHVFLSNRDGSNVYRIVLSQRCGVCVDIELPAVCWFRGGIVLRTTFCQIRFFKKNLRTNFWQKEWYVKSITKPCILVAHPFKNDCLFYHTLEGYLMQISFPEDQDTPFIQRHLHYGAIYQFVDFIYPWCHHIIVTDDSKELVILECDSGKEVSRLDPDLNGIISYQTSHPDYPLIALATVYGELILVSIVHPEEPRIISHMHLQREPLDLIKFSYSGRSLVAAEKKTGNCYCINLQSDKQCSVVAQVQTKKEISDVFLYEFRGILKVLVLYVGVKQFTVGNQFLVYDVSGVESTVEKHTGVLDLPGIFRSLCHAPGNPQLFIASPYLTRQLHVLKIDDFKRVNAVDGLVTGHHVRLARVFTDRHRVTTAAFDGLVFARDKTVRNVVATAMTHHRRDLGVSKAMTSSRGNMIVALGRNGSLVAMRNDVGKESEESTSREETQTLYRVDYGLYERRKKKILSDYASLNSEIYDFLTLPRQGFASLEEWNNKTWTEWRHEKQVEEEAKRCAEKRSAILKDLAALKAIVAKLLDDNEGYPEIEKLPISAFDLDIVGRDQRIKVAKDEREEFRLELEYNCNSMDRVANWIKTNFWDGQRVIGKSIYSLFGTTEVSNYPLAAVEPLEQDFLQWAQFNRESVRNIIDGDTFTPWRKYTEEELRVELSKRAKVHREDERRRMDALLEEEEEEEEESRVDQGDLEEQRAASGTTTHRFVEQSPYYYSQMESYGFAQVLLDNHYLMHDAVKLRCYFNKLFDEVYASKEREMSIIRERNERLRYIDSELRAMFGQSVPQMPVDPEWHCKEKPESTIRVLDHEVKAKPYVSPSQQEVLDKQAAEAERIRQLLLADDFRERALMAMMDGVLEVRWEDVIKIDVPKPRCMLNKQPEQYTTEDMTAVKQYEKDVQFLTAERERYRRILEADYAKIRGLLQEGIDKFNGKLDDFFQLKMRVESAIQQLNLRYVRGCLRNFHRTQLLKEDDKVKEKIAEKQRYELVLAEQVQSFQSVRLDFVAQHENLCAREKPLAKRFRFEFFSLGRATVEILERQYKRRPRIPLRNTSASDLLDLGKHVLSQMKPVHLPAECMDYLKSLEALDVRPSGLPPSVETGHWEHLVRLRRQKIDLELKIKAQQLELLEAERTIALFEAKINRCESDRNSLKQTLDSLRETRRIFELNVELQLVLKMGQVEIVLRGNRDDAANAVLIPRAEVDDVNKHIVAAGYCKLNVMARTVSFHRRSLTKKWEHDCLKMRLDDLKEDSRFLRNIIVTRDIREYLKRKAKGIRDDKTVQQFEKELETVQKRCEETLQVSVAKVNEVARKIAAMRKDNARLDREIIGLNVLRCDMEQQRDLPGEERQREHTKRKMQMIAERSNLIKKLQENYAEILALQTEHELLRMRRFPALDNFKKLDDDSTNKPC